MEGRLLLKNCSILRADGRLRSGMAVAIQGETISEVLPDAEVPVLPGDWEVDCRRRLVAPAWSIATPTSSAASSARSQVR